MSVSYDRFRSRLFRGIIRFRHDRVVFEINIANRYQVSKHRKPRLCFLYPQPQVRTHSVCEIPSEQAVCQKNCTIFGLLAYVNRRFFPEYLRAIINKEAGTIQPVVRGQIVLTANSGSSSLV